MGSLTFSFPFFPYSSFSLSLISFSFPLSLSDVFSPGIKHEYEKREERNTELHVFSFLLTRSKSDRQARRDEKEEKS